MGVKLDSAIETAYQSILESNGINKMKDCFKSYVNLKNLNDRENLRKLERAERAARYWENKFLNRNQ
jgi:hypothetical protein